MNSLVGWRKGVMGKSLLGGLILAAWPRGVGVLKLGIAAEPRF